MAKLLDGRISFITGGARGLGRAIADRFAAEGGEGALFDLAQELKEAEPTGGFTAIAGDVTDEGSLAAGIEETVRRYGKLDVVVANAGVVPGWRETDALDMAEWDRVMAINARGVAATLKHAVPAMRKTGGSIIVMASINAEVAHPRQMLYTAAKHAALGIVRAAAQDLGRFGIRVNALGPGPIATEALLGRIRARSVNGASEADALAALAQSTSLGRLASADEVAKAAVFLASDLSSGISGELIRVDAGLP